jgi:hypothetical protein
MTPATRDALAREVMAENTKLRGIALWLYVAAFTPQNAIAKEAK